MWFKRKAPVLGDFEQLVLLGVLRLERQDSAYGAVIRQEIHARSGRDVSINPLFPTRRSARKKGLSKIPRRRSHPTAGWPPAEILCAAARGYRGAAPSVPCLYRNGGRPREPAGA